MAFSESTTKAVRRRAHFQCCLCKAIGVEIHHIKPQADGGDDTADNAAPLCPTCHETYGANPTKRKFIREARDFWFEICDRRYSSDGSVLHEVHAAVTNAASKDDVSKLRADISQILAAFKPIPQMRSLSIPGRPPSHGEHSALNTRDLILLVAGTSSERPDSQVELLCMKELWPAKGGLRNDYNEFRRLFGDRMLRYLAARALDEYKIKASDGLTEEEISQGLRLMCVEAVCMVALEQGDLIAELDEADQVVWSTRDKASVG